MWAPRFLACSSSSRIRHPAPSPITKPSRSTSNGREALAGSSILVERAFMAANPAMLMVLRAASEPPAMITSASSRTIVWYASPTLCTEVAQAVTTHMLGPLALCFIATYAVDMLLIIMGMKNGLTLFGPFSIIVLKLLKVVSMPPWPLPM